MAAQDLAPRISRGHLFSLFSFASRSVDGRLSERGTTRNIPLVQFLRPAGRTYRAMNSPSISTSSPTLTCDTTLRDS